MTEETVQKLESAFLMDCTVEEACFSANISKQTYYNWINSFPEVKERFDALRENPVFLARQTVIHAIQYDPELAMKYLERKKKSEFSIRQELTGADGKDLLPDPEQKANANKLISEYLDEPNSSNT